jgi:hypothetical protein
MILLYVLCLERRDEKALAISAAKTTQPMKNSQYNRLSDSLLSWNKDICRRETGTIAGKGNPFRRCRRRCAASQLIYFSRLIFGIVCL